MFKYNLEFFNNTLFKTHSTKLQNCGLDIKIDNNSNNSSMALKRFMLSTAKKENFTTKIQINTMGQ